MQLVLSPVVRYHIAELARRAHAEPIAHHHIRLLVGRNRPWPPEVIDRRQIHVPHGYRIALDTAYYRPRALCRHVAVRGPGKWPNRESLDKLLVLIGFQHPLEACWTWHDGDDQRTVHALEPVDGDWSPLRSS